MQSIDLIRENLARSAERVLAGVADMREHGTLSPTPRGGCHTLWVLGHLAYTEQLIIRELMLGEANPLAEWKDLFDRDEVETDASLFPPFDDVLATCRRVRASTIALIDALSEDDLDEPSAKIPEGWEQTFGSRRLCLQFVADHWYMHRGQLADARRAADLHRAWV